MFFKYSEEQIEQLKMKDETLAAVIDRIGPLEVKIMPDLFSALVAANLYQQIKPSRAKKQFDALREGKPFIDPARLADYRICDLEKLGIGFRKANYIHRIAQGITDQEIDLSSFKQKSDKECIADLSLLPGIGSWSAEMLLIYSMNRMDVFPVSDKALQNGLKIVYHHRELSEKQLEKYRLRFSPYGSLASLYLWKVAEKDLGDSSFKENE